MDDDFEARGAWYRDEIKKRDQRIAELEAEAKEIDRLFELQRTRMREATELWRQGRPEREHVFPDLGALLTWLMARPAELEAEVTGAADLLEDALALATDTSPPEWLGFASEWLAAYRKRRSET